MGSSSQNLGAADRISFFTVSFVTGLKAEKGVPEKAVS